jgi:hypothetical protein
VVTVHRAGIVAALISATGCNMLAGLDDLGFGATSSSATQASSNTATSSSVAGGGMSGGGSGGAGGQGAGTGATIFFSDDFERPDDVDVGNGWIEKDPAWFELELGAVNKLTGGDYRDNLVYRPVGESQLDIEATVEFVILDAGVPGYPNVLVRLQEGFVANAGSFEGYMLFVDNSLSAAMVSRQLTIGDAPIVQLGFGGNSLVQGTTYRLRLRVVGTDPVVVDGFIEEQVGIQWETIASGHAEDSAFERITTAGTFGFSADVEGMLRYDNYAAFPP